MEPSDSQAVEAGHSAADRKPEASASAHPEALQASSGLSVFRYPPRPPHQMCSLPWLLCGEGLVLGARGPAVGITLLLVLAA